MLAEYEDRMAAFAADPRLGPLVADGVEAPAVAPATAEELQHDRDQAVLQEALGDGFTLFDGAVTLEPGSAKWAELPGGVKYGEVDSPPGAGPDGVYSGVAELTTITRSAFDAACNARPGAAACEERTLADGRTVHLRSWADQDAEGVRGESAAYFVQPDGDIVLADLVVTGTMVPDGRGAAHVAKVRTFLDSLESALIAAVTDERVTAAS